MTHQMIQSMVSIKGKFKVADLLVALKKHAATHDEEYKSALVGYRQDVLARIKELYNLAKKQDFVKWDQHVHLTTPVDCSSAYKDLIQVFSFMTDTVIELDLGEANRLLNNSWDWASSASLTNSYYAAKVASSR